MLTFNEIIDLIEDGIDDAHESPAYPGVYATENVVDGDREVLVNCVALRVFAALVERLPEDTDWPPGEV